jgi:glucokinase
MILALDFGGTKLAAGLVDAAGAVVAERRCPSPPDAGGGYAAMLAMARELLAEAPARPAACGVSFGGLVAADGRTVRLSMHVAGWEQAPLAAWVERDLGLPCAVANDADAAALGEQRFGAGRGAALLLYLTVSTGVGGGVVAGGQLFRGAHALAGEVGHQCLDPHGPPCPCGRNGCLEALASGRAIARAAGMPDALAAAAGDPAARQAWDTAMGWLGIGVANAANILNPDRVVIGGGVAGAGELLLGPVRAVAAARCLDPDLRVELAALGPRTGLAGAAAVATSGATR